MLPQFTTKFFAKVLEMNILPQILVGVVIGILVGITGREARSSSPP